MKKILIIQQIIPHYRIPVFNALASKYQLTVAAELFEEPQKYAFNKVEIQIKNKGPFTLIKQFDKLGLEDFHSVIFTFNIRYLSLIKLLYKRSRKYQVILWGIGVSSENGFDNSSRFDRIRYWAARKADALIFYSDYPLKKYSEYGKIPLHKMFVANNTLNLEAKYFEDEKEIFLFVGTLKKYKQINKLVDIFHAALNKHPNLPELHIIGDGEYMHPLIQQIENLDLGEKVILHGAINDSKKLENFYRKAIASISPFQAGLSVLQSLSMGVPFITFSNAVTGGERFNIKHGYNGFLINNEEAFITTLIDLGKDRSQVRQLSQNAFKYFKENCGLDKMLEGFLGAIEKSDNER